MTIAALLTSAPFADRDEPALLAEMNAVTQWHLEHCADYRLLWPRFTTAMTLAELPFLHVGAFKHREWRTIGDGITHQRTLTSSATGGQASRILLDDRSAGLQAQSSGAIIKALLGADPRPLLILDDAKALQQRGEIGARVTAAMALRPVASELHFLLSGREAPESIDWAAVAARCASSPRLVVYGFTWMLWLAWAQGAIPEDVRAALSRTQVHFVHSGGWKKLDAMSVSRAQFDAALLATVAPGSEVLDFYGLVEQVGVIYPLCAAGNRHVPRWAAVLVRDPWTLATPIGAPGLLQLMNPLAWGAPYHNVLTEDLGRIPEGECPCGRGGQHFELIGRVPQAEVRGCANV